MELHASSVRAHNAIVNANHAVSDFHDRWVNFASHSHEIISQIGSERFASRFDPQDEPEDIMSVLGDMVDEYNNDLKSREGKMSPNHVANYNPSPAAHNMTEHDGGSPTPTFQRMAEKSPESDDEEDPPMGKFVSSFLFLLP
jgi:hypothetical protein